MITIQNIPNEKPYEIFMDYFQKAKSKEQKSIEAINISSFNTETKEISSRLVNLKYIIHNKWYFFSNYNSPKAKDFESFNKISAVQFWSEINTQIRIKGNIFKASEDFSDTHYKKRSKEKNALAHSSDQSMSIASFVEVKKNYKDFLANEKLILQRPKNWGGFYFVPNYFEFWEGNKFRLNKRKEFKLIDDKWIEKTLQP